LDKNNVNIKVHRGKYMYFFTEGIARTVNFLSSDGPVLGVVLATKSHAEEVRSVYLNAKYLYFNTNEFYLRAENFCSTVSVCRWHNQLT
jgi:hypothetical protein